MMFARRVSPRVGSRCRVYVGLALAAAVLSGCHRDTGPERVVVSGTVTFHGKPVSGGTIRFIPISTSPVPVSGAPIDDGKYKIDSKGGVPVGTHTIQIEAYHRMSLAQKPGAAVPPNFTRGKGSARQQYIPSRYNMNSTLKITIEPGSREIVKNFDLTD
jgi:hypothetical protein